MNPIHQAVADALVAAARMARREDPTTSDICGVTGCSRTSMNALLREMLAAGHVEKTNRRRWRLVADAPQCEPQPVERSPVDEDIARYSALEEATGRGARMAGLDLADNPHTVGSGARECWRRGFLS